MDGELHHAMHPGSLPVLALKPEANRKHGGLGAGALDELPCMTSWKLGRCAKAEVSTAKFKSRPLQNFGNHSTGLSTILPSQASTKCCAIPPRTRSRTQHSLAKRLGPPSTPSLPKPASASNHPTAGPLPCAALASPFAHLGIPSFLVPRDADLDLDLAGAPPDRRPPVPSQVLFVANPPQWQPSAMTSWGPSTSCRTWSSTR